MGTIWDLPTDDGDAQLSQLLGAATVDAAGLTFSFSCPASARSVRVDYIFGSDEYAGFTNPEDLLDVHEGIVILIDGVNAARLNNGMPVTVPNLQLFAPGSFRDNNACHEPSGEACPFNVEADGFSGKLIAQTIITPGTGPHQAKIVIADDFFEDIDSWVLLRAFSCSDGTSATNQVPDLGSFGALWLGLGLLGVAGITRLRRFGRARAELS